MLSFDPTHRLSIAEILSHPWVTGEILMGEGNHYYILDIFKKLRGKEIEVK